MAPSLPFPLCVFVYAQYAGAHYLFYSGNNYICGNNDCTTCDYAVSPDKTSIINFYRIFLDRFQWNVSVARVTDFPPHMTPSAFVSTSVKGCRG